MALSMPWIVHKFGGTSVANAEAYQAVGRILSKSNGKRAVIVSAMSKVTDSLIEVVHLAQARDDSYLSKLEMIQKKHLEALDRLNVPESYLKLARGFEADVHDIQEILRGIWHTRTCPERTVELISGFGEIWSAQLLDATLKSQKVDSTWLDARLVLMVEPTPTSVVVDFKESKLKLMDWMEKNPSELLVITGFVASTPEGIPTTLKRNGSDFSASIFGSLLNASEVIIWTDVDGVLSADPRLVPDAVVLEDLSYNEASELAYFGAKVVHPSTMAPVIQSKIPIWIRNTFNPGFRGTKIHDRSSSTQTVKGLATIDRVALVNVEGTGMVGIPGVAQSLFGALKEVGVSVIMISQASSEHSICFVVPEAQAAAAKSVLQKALFAELHQGLIQTIEFNPNCCVLAAVGDNMVENPGAAGAFLGALGRARVNVRAIAQGSSERNISVVVDRSESRRALRAVHSAFYLSNQTLSVGLIGPGLIGGTFLEQLSLELQRLKNDLKVDLRVRGIMDSKKMILSDQPVNLNHWRELFSQSTASPNLDQFIEHVQSDYLPHSVVIDCTGSDDLPLSYPDWLKKGLNIITPNKKGNTRSMEFYRELHTTARSNRRHFLYETNVGAGLPIIHTLRDLVKTGDRIIQIEGVLSGTMSYIFNVFTGEKPFSEIVRAAKEKGFTEPDPREDLSGMDVARKLVILAREINLDLELDHVDVESLVPAELRAGTSEEFLLKLAAHDGVMDQRVRDARQANQVLRYVGIVNQEKKASVKLGLYSKEHPFAQLGATDNIVAFTTKRYCERPLIVQGPGAGPEVTAAGVFGGLLRLASYLGGPS